MEKQKHFLGDIVYKITYGEIAEPPYVEKGIVCGTRYKDDKETIEIDVAFYQDENKRYYFKAITTGLSQKDLYNNPEKPMSIVKKILENQNRKRNRAFRKRLKELGISKTT